MSIRSAARLIEPQVCPAYILAGGRSSRFGSDKALVQVGGLCLLELVISTLQAHGHQVFVVADRADRYRQIGLECLVDRLLGCGPLAGMAAALEHRRESGSGWSLLLNCDQWIWLPAWFQALNAYASDEVEAIGFVSQQFAPAAMEPLPCLLHTRLLPEISKRLELKQLALWGLFNGARTKCIEIEPSPRLWAFNTPAELDALRLRCPQ